MTDHANQLGHIGVIDDLVDRPRADQQRRRTAENGTAFRAIEKKVARQAQDHLHATAGKHAFAPMRKVGRMRVPERADKAGERRGGEALKVNHATS